MATYAVIRIPDLEEEIIIPADSFEVTDEGELIVYRYQLKVDGTINYRPWAQFSSYVGIYLVDDGDEDEVEEEDEDEEEEDYDDVDEDEEDGEDDEADEEESAAVVEVPPSILVEAEAVESASAGALNGVPESLSAA